MKKIFLLTLSLTLISVSAQAVKLVNRDSQSHQVIIQCSSTSHSSIGASSTRDLGSGPCTVTLKSTGASAKASGSTNIVIQKGGTLTTS